MVAKSATATTLMKTAFATTKTIASVRWMPVAFATVLATSLSADVQTSLQALVIAKEPSLMPLAFAEVIV